MLIKKIFLNLFIFSILIGGFVYAYFKFDNTAQATTLIFCIKNDYTNYITLDSDQTCPEGYFLAPDGFNLNLIQQSTITPTLDDIYQNSTSSNNGTTTGGSSYNNSTSSNNGTDGNGFYDQDGVYHPNPEGNPYDYTYPTNTYPTNTNPNNNPNSNNPTIFDVNPNPTITIDPTLEHGPFENLDPRDYKYCVLLKQNLMVGMNDANTGREISALQAYLYDRGFSNISATGIFDQNTALAVKRFQYRNQVEVSGIVKADTRSIIQELTCAKYPVITYKDKPIAPEVLTVKVTTNSYPNKTTTVSTPKPTPTPKPTTSTPKVEEEEEDDTSKVVIIPDTKIEDDTSTTLISPLEGNMYLSRGNNLYFTYITKSKSPYICLSLNNTDCSQSNNYKAVNEGINTGLYEVVNFGSFYSFNLYNGLVWGSAGDKVRVYLKDSQDSPNSSIYIVNIFN